MGKLCEGGAEAIPEGERVIFTPKRIEELTREQINNLVNVSDVESGKKRTEAVAKARIAAYGMGHKGTATADNAAVNAVLRAIRRDGPMETYKVAAAMAAVESATYAEIASDALTDSEYTILVRPLARAIGEPEKRPRPAQAPVPRTDYALTPAAPPDEPTPEELEAFFGETPDPVLTHEWEQSIKAAPEQYPVNDLVPVGGVAREMEDRVSSEEAEEFDLFS